jgi:hypothetical protein
MDDSRVFCDFLSVTFSCGDWDQVKEAIAPALDSVGAQVEMDSEDGTLWRSGDGTVRAKRYRQVMSLGASGSMLAALRFAGAFGAYLTALGSVPHRVTRLDASKDIVTPTAPVIASLVDRASTPDGVKLTRKRVGPSEVTRLVSRQPDGSDSGTVYLGGPSAEVRACVYDKRLERMKNGLCDVGPLTRYELRLKSQVGMTLRDAYDPEVLFWHFMAPDVLPAPGPVVEWIPQADGFAIDWPPHPSPLARLQRRVDTSDEVAALLRLANEVGPYGFGMLVAALERRHKGVTGQAPSETASNAICEPPGATTAGNQPPPALTAPRAC